MVTIVLVDVDEIVRVFISIVVSVGFEIAVVVKVLVIVNGVRVVVVGCTPLLRHI